MKKFFKSLLMVCIIFTLAVSGTVFASPVNAEAVETDATPRTMYYYSGSLGFAKGNGYVLVDVSTSAITYIDSIYHDVTIYKNGVKYLSQRYSGTNCQTLSTSIKVPAVGGDVIEVYVNHYTSHNGIVEDGYHYDSYMR